MIVSLSGKILELEEGMVVIDVGGVGYGVEASQTTLHQLPSAGSEVSLKIYHHITDNDQRLFGFLEPLEKRLFEKLITVKGIGPKGALTILSGHPYPDLLEIIVSGQTTRLSSVPGIGAKTAERIVLELRDKLGQVDITHSRGLGSTDSPNDEVLSALEALGYPKKTVAGALHELAGSANPPTETANWIKQALVILNR
ncbi:MAG: Holliday junction branch migration protein RuvA [Bacteroidetes bacterium]|nr:Holliday junction branch migration protein RuvA [Bacteroidota bacterium]